jgi:acyl-CoA synthetase (AMP-forming)/AMP-acid ligase II
VRKGGKDAVLLETHSEYVETYAALASLGAIALTLNIRFHPDEIAQCRKDHLGVYKLPRDIAFMRAEELPHSTTVKLQRHLLVAIATRGDEPHQGSQHREKIHATL